MTPTTRLRAWLPLLLLSAALAAPAAASTDIEVPYLTGRVVDNAQVMEAYTRGRISERLRAHEQATGNQVVVLTVPTIGSLSIEEYAVKVFEAWKLGQKDKDNGVLVIVVPQDRKMRIEVGYGLEPTLTDGACGQIIRSVMTPQFKAGNYDRGIEEGVGAIVGKLEGSSEIPSAPEPESHAAGSFGDVNLPWTERLLIGAFVFSIIGLFTVMGVLTPGVGWFLYFFLIPFWAMFPIVVVGVNGAIVLLGTYLVGYPVAKILLARTAWYRKAKSDLKTKGTASIGGFTFSSGGSSSFSSSGGGFSGGGGSSGGGGCSGSW